MGLTWMTARLLGGRSAGKQMAQQQQQGCRQQPGRLHQMSLNCWIVMTMTTQQPHSQLVCSRTLAGRLLVQQQQQQQTPAVEQQQQQQILVAEQQQQLQ
jgi:hypothetical protein